MKPLLVATANPGKFREFRALIPRDVAIVGLVDVNVAMPAESGVSFRDIAGRKARFAARASGLVTLADDSGLEVDALAGAPGVLSARYAGEPSDDALNRALLLANLAGLPPSQRGARFVCALTIASPNGLIWTSEGELRGTIFDRERGTGGFGYDAVFLLPDGRTLAELLDEEKNAMSHRAAAMAKILPDLRRAVQSPHQTARASQ